MMSERFRERLGLLSEELDGSSLRSVSPVGSRSPRRLSRSPRPHAAQEPAIAITHPLIRDSRPEIAAWPAPPTVHPLSCISGNVRTPTVAPAPLSPSPISPISHSSPSSSKHDFDNTASLLTALKAAAGNNNMPHIAGRETELKRKIQTLEETVAEYERQKYNVMGTFSEYRERVAERERKLEADYSGKIIALSEEVLGAKKDFEARMKSFQALQDKFEREKEQALEKLRQEHQKEIQLLEQRFSDTQLLNLEQKYILEIQRLEEERKSLRTEKERLGETFEMKLRRAQSLYETELTATKMLYTRELEALRDHEEALKEELLARQDEFHDRLQELQLQSKRSREELTTCKNEVTALEKKLLNKEKEVKSITRELDEARNETNECLKRISIVTAEHAECREKFQQHEEELNRKARLLSVVEAAKQKLELVITDLQIEVRTLKNKVEFLEKERDNLQSQSESQTQLQSSQVDALEAVLDSVTKEKESTREHYETLLMKERQQAEAREHAMKKEFSSKLNELEEQYTSLKEELEESARLDKDELRESTQNEIRVLKTEKEILEAEVRALTDKISGEDQDDVTAQLAKIVDDTTRLTQALEEYRERINSKDEEIGQLRKRIDQEVFLTEDRHREVMEKARNEVMRNSEVHESNLRQVKAELDEFRRECNNERKLNKDRNRKIKELEDQNIALHSELEHLHKALEAMEEDTKSAEALRENVEKKNSTIAKLEDQIVLLTDELTKKEVSAEEGKTSAVKMEELERTIAELQGENVGKTEQIEKLHARVNDMMEQMGSIKEELQKKNEEIKMISTKNDGVLKQQEHQKQSVSEQKLSLIKQEHEQQIEELRAQLKMGEKETAQKEWELNQLQENLSQKEESLEQMQEELDSLTQRLNEETAVVLMDSTVEDRIREKDEVITSISHKLEHKERELASLRDKLDEYRQMQEGQLREKDDLVEQLRHAREQNGTHRDERLTMLTSEVTPENFGQPAVVDQAKERELKDRIEELEGALERKNELIQQLQGRLSDEGTSDSFSKKRSSITSHGVFQNFVSQMKDKRDEAHERSKQKETEKKAEKEKERAAKAAAKEAAKEIAREKSPARSKSPSLLTRLRDRSPKARSPNLETTPSNSSRNLLSPSDAERRMERTSPSRPLFSRSKKENSEKRPAWKF